MLQNIVVIIQLFTQDATGTQVTLVLIIEEERNKLRKVFWMPLQSKVPFQN